MTDGNMNFISDELQVGSEISGLEWVKVTQQLIDSPFGGTIAFEFFTMSMLTHLMYLAQGRGTRDGAADSVTHAHYLNYDFSSLRLFSSVPVGARIRGKFKVKDLVINKMGRNILTFDTVVKTEDSERPALVADWLAVWVRGQTP